jgi:uncharacterized protein
VIVYLDASALVKRFVAEAGSDEVATLIERADAVGTVVLSRAEVAAALAKAQRMKVVPREGAEAALRTFDDEWAALIRIQMTEVLAARAASMAWAHGLRGYDAVHVAAAAFWQDMLGEEITVATYDRQLWDAARAAGLVAWPARAGSARDG